MEKEKRVSERDEGGRFFAWAGSAVAVDGSGSKARRMVAGCGLRERERE